MADEPTLGELSRQISALSRSVDHLSTKVLTVEQWRAERELIESRVHRAEKDIADLEAKADAEREKRSREHREAEQQSAANRRTTLLALVTAFVAPIVVGIALAVVLGS